MTEQAEALIAKKLPNGKTIDDQTALDSLSRIIPMLESDIGNDYEDIKDDPRLNHIVEIIKKGKVILDKNKVI